VAFALQQVSAVDAGGVYLDEDLAPTRGGHRPVFYAQVVMFRFDSHVAALLGYLVCVTHVCSILWH
jgi:hypothetical protein